MSISNFFSSIKNNATREINEFKSVVSPAIVMVNNEIAQMKIDVDLAVKNTAAAGVVKTCVIAAKSANYVEVKATAHGLKMAASITKDMEVLNAMQGARVPASRLLS